MDHQKKLDFVLKMTKHALDSMPVQHFGIGGVVSDLGRDLTIQNDYSANLAPTTQVDYTAPQQQALGNINQGYNQSQSLLGQQQDLANQFAAQSRGEGYNPAMSALNQRTGENISQQAALAAGTRGAGANAGLIAANNARQGAALQQQSVGQGAVLQAQQSNQALQGQMAQQNNILGNIQGQQGIQGNLYGAATNANTAQNNTNVNNTGMSQGLNAKVEAENAAANQKTNSGLWGGIAGGITSAPLGGLLGGSGGGGGGGGGFYKGGEVQPEHDEEHLDKIARIYHPQMYANGGEANFGVQGSSTTSVGQPSESNYKGGDSTNINIKLPSKWPGSKEGAEKGAESGAATEGSAATDGSATLTGSQGAAASTGDVAASGGAEAAGGLELAGGAETASAAGGLGALAGEGELALVALKSGGQVPGKAKVNHDAYKNDTVPAMLSPGEVVIDLNTLKDKGKLGKMARFVAANIERKKAGRKL